jgi:hypothetical protein
MAKQYRITQIEYNQKMAFKYNGAFLYTVGVESDAKRKDFVFDNSKQFKVLQECAVGNIVELKIVKNGDFFNLAKEDDAIVLVSKEVKIESTPPTKSPEGPATGAVQTGSLSTIPAKEYTKYKEDPDKQAAIIRQNALTNATNLVIACGVPNVDNAIKHIIATAIQFAKFTSGEDMTEYLMEEDAPFEPAKVKRGPKAKEEKDTVYGPAGEFGE